MTDEGPSPFISIQHISKAFAGVQALSDVGLQVKMGEAVCLAGENGSGKSTLIKILAGVEKPDSGSIEIDGKSHASLNPRSSVAAGIQVIFQDFSLFPNLSVAENIAFSAELTARKKLVRNAEMRRIAAAVLDRIGVPIDLNARVETLPVADKQLVAICRALVSQARLIIMDEPTTALTDREVRALLAIIRRLKAEGVAVLFVSHKLAEIFEVCEKIVVIRNGRLVVDGATAGFSLDSLAHHMTGRHFIRTTPVIPEANLPEILAVRGLRRNGLLDDISFSLRAGEVLGISGLLGSGRTELAKALFGLMEVDGGAVAIQGVPTVIRNPGDAIDAGIGYVPEDRLTEGLFLSQSIARNIAVSRLDDHAGMGGLIDRQGLSAEIDEWLHRLKVVASPDAPVKSLSGGNQQRIVLARWLAKSPKILILNGPTVGVDIGSKADIHQVIAALAAAGIGVIVISDDIPEVLATCHRILVMRGGRIVEELAGGSVTESDLAHRLAS
ncbi:sugar ABC transporter ATP-binding protein [Dongia soli]|uniref:Sugar ABC transporter ATP-binding protein n=1 Tax=Dongia soli TaxID=600628 RepID=A0ABU5E8G0_9PROT|nr:sugar ABC transporter ATP-binding protein [Dongia soli]MDY0882613.1 sugar ABC transporter ATP-binding protein [Dongia soli]